MLWAQFKFEIVSSPACPKWLRPAIYPIIPSWVNPGDVYNFPGMEGVFPLHWANPAVVPTGNGKFPTVIEEWNGAQPKFPVEHAGIIAL